MKSITKMMVIAVVMLVAASLFVAPATARVGAITNVANGDTVFVYESGLNLTNVTQTGATTITSLRKYTDDDPSKALLNEIPVANRANFEVLDAAVAGQYGVYYPFPGGAGGLAQTNNTVVIRDPTATLDVVLNQSHSDSVNGKSLTKASSIAFKITSPFVGANYKFTIGATTYYPGKMKVTLTTPLGGKITTFGTANYASIWVNSSQMYTDLSNSVNQASVLTNVEAGTYTAIAEWVRPTGFADYAADSNSVTFTVESQILKIESDKDTVVRGNNFVTTISGESKKNYYLYIKDASLTNINQYPIILVGQPSVNRSAAAAAVIGAFTTEDSGYEGTMAIVTTTASGTRPIEFNTTQLTDDRSFTIKVVDPLDASKYDDVKVKVEKGSVTVTASGDQTYFLGEEVTFSGTNTDSSNIYMFITGPNLNTNGERLDAIGTASVTGTVGTFKQVTVETDDTWEYKWDTAGVGLDAGTYTVYAVSQPNNKGSLTNVKYATVSIVVKKPFVSATTSASTVAKGDKLFISGTAEGNPTQGVAIWVLGKNYYLRATETVEDDGSFSYELTRGTTQTMASGQYFVVVQHPMYNDQFDIIPNLVGAVTWVRNVILGGGTNVFIINGAGSLQGSDAAEALVQAINDPNIDDTYTKLTFLVEEPWIQIDPIADKYVGDTFTITGTTNLAVDDELLVEVVSSSFKPTEKTQSGEFSGASGTIAITKGDTYNTWAFDVDAATFKPDEYIVKVESIEADQTATATFNVLAGAAPTTAPTAQPTAEPTGEPTAEPTAQPTAQPTATPGFGALIALIGLGAVAVLVLRKH
ncbi:MAG: DUF3821 domain-containing protein [Methanomicrobiales archaeon]|nr:DUF3821 domain-containing protein [Methanomicrobiales archaeon]